MEALLAEALSDMGCRKQKRTPAVTVARAMQVNAATAANYIWRNPQSMGRRLRWSY
jgi:hypothetical protein